VRQAWAAQQTNKKHLIRFDLIIEQNYKYKSLCVSYSSPVKRSQQDGRRERRREREREMREER
jgi:hypothetical protein